MKTKRIATVALLAFVGASVAYLVVQETTPKPAGRSDAEQTAHASPQFGTPDEVEPTSAAASEQTAHQLVAYYFHRTQRCQTCLAIERYAKEALEDAFPQALGTGELQWRVLNVEEPANEHFVQEYALTSSALVLVDSQPGEQKTWRTLERVWELVDDELEFKVYVESEALALLEPDS